MDVVFKQSKVNILIPLSVDIYETREITAVLLTALKKRKH